MIPDTRTVGQQSQWTATFTNADGELDDPITVRVLWKERSEAGEGEVFVYGVDDEIVRVSTGVYQFTSPIYDDPTVHIIRVESTGLATAIEETVRVSPSSFAVAP